MPSTFDYSGTTKGSDTTSRHKKGGDDKEKRYGSHMAGLGRSGAQPGGGGGGGGHRGARSHRSHHSPFSLLHPNPHPSGQVFAKISRWGDICWRGFWRTIEKVSVEEPDEREIQPTHPHRAHTVVVNKEDGALTPRSNLTRWEKNKLMKS